MLSHIRLFGAPWTVAHQVPLSMEFSRHEYWSGLPCSPLGDLPKPGIEPTTLMSLALVDGSLPLVPKKIHRTPSNSAGTWLSTADPQSMPGHTLRTPVCA